MEETLGTAPFSDALAKARQAYEASKAVQVEQQDGAKDEGSNEEDETLAEETNGTPEAPASDEDASDLTDGQEDEEGDEESDDESDEDSDESDEEDETSDDEDEVEDEDEAPIEEAPEPADKKSKKTRRSQKVNKLSTRIKELEQKLETSESTMLERLQQEQQRRAQLEAQQRQREQEAAQVEQELAGYLGSPAQYEAAVSAALDGDVEAQEIVKGWRQNRQVVQKLTLRAEQVVNQRAAQVFWEATQGLEGLDRDVLQEASMPDVLRHLYEAGGSVTKAHYEKEIATRDRRIATLEARIKGQKVKNVAKQAAPIESGRPVPAPKAKTTNPYAKLMDESGRIVPGALEKLRQFGGAALQ